MGYVNCETYNFNICPHKSSNTTPQNAKTKIRPFRIAPAQHQLQGDMHYGQVKKGMPPGLSIHFCR